MNRLRAQLDRWLGHFLVALLAIMTFNVVWQVLSRYLLKSPSSFTDELARYLLIWLGMFGSAYAAGQGQHLSIDLLVQYIGPRASIRISKVVSLFILLFAALVIVFGGARLVYLTFILKQTSAALQVPLGVVYLSIPISGLLICIYQWMDLQSHNYSHHVISKNAN